jgi:biotin carboxyl carrier protein
MKRYQITINARTFDVEMLSDPQQDRVEVAVDGQPLTVEVKLIPPAEQVAGLKADAQSAQVRAAATPDLSAGIAPSGKTVRSPLPGVVKSIAVRPGEQVSKGDKLLVIEAMKMNNLIRASRQGVVGAIHVAEGRQVAYGELLLEYED